MRARASRPMKKSPFSRGFFRLPDQTVSVSKRLFAPSLTGPENTHLSPFRAQARKVSTANTWYSAIFGSLNLGLPGKCCAPKPGDPVHRDHEPLTADNWQR
ncbi:hypothetical protein PUN4_500035 [Paraburkholderia unamae]|nr:hypothetical protein PUN4_500035 [Paraburkholderia unamae]